MEVARDLTEPDCAAAEVEARPSFRRLIWAPKLVFVQRERDGEPDEKAEPVPRQRDPLKVLSSVNRQLDSDQVDGDTEAKFREFLLQHLEPRAPEGRGARLPLVYIRFDPVDLTFAREVYRAVKELGLVPQLAPQDGSV